MDDNSENIENDNANVVPEETEVLNDQHAYIHVPPEKTGEKFQRLIVTVTKPRRFDYDTYVTDVNTYKDKAVKYKNEEGKKIKCFVLFAADNLSLVEAKVERAKRWRIPTVKDTGISDASLSQQSEINSLLDDDDAQDEQASLKRAKSGRKDLKKLKLQATQETNGNILEKYLNNIDSNNVNNKTVDKRVESTGSNNYNVNENTGEGTFEVDENEENEYPLHSFRTSGNKNSYSTPLRSTNGNVRVQQVEKENQSVPSNVINAYKEQVKFFRGKYEDAKKEAQEWKTKYESILNKKSLDSSQSDYSFLEYYDKLYKYDGPLKVNEELDCVKLLHNVECKTIAYKHAFKSSKPIQLVRQLMISIYGYDDLSKSCQKREFWSSPTPELRPLCKKKCEAIERELYRFLRLNNYSAPLIKLELQEIDKYYHNAISCARLQKKRQKKAEDALAELQQQLAESNGTLYRHNST